MATADYDEDGLLVACKPVTCDKCGFLLTKLFLTLDVVLAEVGDTSEIEGIRVLGEAQCCGNKRTMPTPSPQAVARVLNHMQTCRTSRNEKPGDDTPL